MYAALFRPVVTVALLVLAIPLVSAVMGTIDGNDDPKYVGGAAVMGLVAILLLLLLGLGPTRAGLACGLLGASSVMTYAVSGRFGSPEDTLLNISSLAMAALCVWSGAALTDKQANSDAVSPF